MRTLVLRIPDALAADLTAEAKRLALTKSEVARRRLTTPGTSVVPSPGFALIADLVGSVKGTPPDLSSRKKHYLRTKGYGKSKRNR